MLLSSLQRGKPALLGMSFDLSITECGYCGIFLFDIDKITIELCIDI